MLGILTEYISQLFKSVFCYPTMEICRHSGQCVGAWTTMRCYTSRKVTLHFSLWYELFQILIYDHKSSCRIDTIHDVCVGTLFS